MKVVFFGTPPFAAKVLTCLFENDIDIVAVVTRTDKPKGRSGKLLPTPVKATATAFLGPNIPIFQPEKVSAPEFADVLPRFEADLFVVVAYGEILRQHILDIPRLGCINVHASLLPKYRGAAPIQRAIINGEDETGITIMHMVRKMDAGGMIRRRAIAIGPADTFGMVEQKLCGVGSELLLEVIRDFEAGTVSETPQDEAEVTFAPKIELEDCQIHWNQPAKEIHNLVRGVNPFPGAWCYVEHKGFTKRLKIWSTQIEAGSAAEPGTIIECTDEGTIVGCGEGLLKVLEVQLEGKQKMPLAMLLRGSPITLKGDL